MAKDNLLWGYLRIVGELKKIGCCIGKTTVKRILENEGMHPLPAKSRKRLPIEWPTFVHAHMESIFGKVKREYLNFPSVLYLINFNISVRFGSLITTRKTSPRIRN